MRTSSIGYASADGASRIHALVWEPESAGVTPKGIVQIIHGMAEHVERYEPFAEALVAQGYVVCAEDHVGHGGSVADSRQLGHIPRAAGAEALLADVHELRRIVAGRYSSTTPYFFFGHSMGSYMLRSYLTRHAEGLAGAVICGTGQVPAALSSAGLLLAGAIGALRGEEHRSKLLHLMGTGAYAKAVENPRTPLDWLSANERNVDAYIADPLCGSAFSVSAYAALLKLTKEAGSSTRASLIPIDLPMLFVSGSEDPVGAKGAGVREALDEYRQAGIRDLELKLYEGMRHEILNEDDASQVIADVLDWLERHPR